MFSSFPFATHVSSPAQDDVLALQTDEFRDPQARLDRDQQDDLVPPSDPGGRIRGRNQCVDLLTREIFDQLSLVPFARNRQYPATQVCVAWFLERYIAEEGMDGCQAGIPRPDAVGTLRFKVVEELADEGRVQFFEGEL